jgi:hypothetical protein
VGGRRPQASATIDRSAPRSIPILTAVLSLTALGSVTHHTGVPTLGKLARPDGPPPGYVKLVCFWALADDLAYDRGYTGGASRSDALGRGYVQTKVHAVGASVSSAVVDLDPYIN